MRCFLRRGEGPQNLRVHFMRFAVEHRLCYNFHHEFIVASRCYNIIFLLPHKHTSLFRQPLSSSRSPRCVCRCLCRFHGRSAAHASFHGSRSACIRCPRELPRSPFRLHPPLAIASTSSLRQHPRLTRFSSGPHQRLAPPAVSLLSHPGEFQLAEVACVFVI